MQELSQNQLKSAVLEALFDFANTANSGKVTAEELVKKVGAPTLRVDLALKSLLKSDLIESEFNDDDYTIYYFINEEGYTSVEDSRLSPGHKSEIIVPASDRIVMLSDNQQTEILEASDKLIHSLEQANAVDGDEATRSRFLAQINAARELVRSQSVRAYLYYQVVVEVLTKLINVYGKTALGIAASKLLELYIEYLAGK